MGDCPGMTGWQGKKNLYQGLSIKKDVFLTT
jgi:hypothetical protein